MSQVEARLDRVECTVRVSWAPETVKPAGPGRRTSRYRSTVIAVPESVQWTAFLYGATDQVYATFTVFGQDVDGERSNATFFPDFEDVPSWIPAPPAWYVDAVAELRAAGEDLSKRVSR